MKRNICKMLLCLGLGLGSMMGMPINPEEIEKLMYSMNQPKIEMTIPDEDGDGDES